MTDELFVPFKFRTTVQLSPLEIYGNIQDRIRDKLKQQLEGVCSRFGFVQPNSIEVVRRSAGVLLKAHFNGHVKFEVACKARVCNPVHGMILSGTVVNKNQLGILADCKIQIQGRDTSVLDVIIPYRTAGMQSDVDLEKFGLGDKIFFEVVGKRSQVNDRKISVIGRGVHPPNSPMALAAAAAALAEDERGEDEPGTIEDDYYEDDVLEDQVGGDMDEEERDADAEGADDEEEEKDPEKEVESDHEKDSDNEDGFTNGVDSEEEEEEEEEDIEDDLEAPEDDFEDTDVDFD